MATRMGPHMYVCLYLCVYIYYTTRTLCPNASAPPSPTMMPHFRDMLNDKEDMSRSTRRHQTLACGWRQEAILGTSSGLLMCMANSFSGRRPSARATSAHPVRMEGVDPTLNLLQPSSLCFSQGMSKRTKNSKSRKRPQSAAPRLTSAYFQAVVFPHQNTTSAEKDTKPDVNSKSPRGSGALYVCIQSCMTHRQQRSGLTWYGCDAVIFGALHPKS